jgi:hypothetical protein
LGPATTLLVGPSLALGDDGQCCNSIALAVR